MPTVKPEIVPPPPFAVYAKRPSLQVTSQHGAACQVGTAPLITLTRPSRLRLYDEAEPDAFEVRRLPRLSKSKPNGVPPVDGERPRPASGTSLSTAKVSIELVAFSVTTSTRPFRLNEICAGPDAPGPIARVEFGIGARPSPCVSKPVMFVGAPRVQHVQQVVVDGEADRHRPAGRHGRLPLEAAAVDGEARDRVAARVDGVEVVAVEDDRALRAEPAARAGAARRIAVRAGERAVGGAA